MNSFALTRPAACACGPQRRRRALGVEGAGVEEGLEVAGVEAGLEVAGAPFSLGRMPTSSTATRACCAPGPTTFSVRCVKWVRLAPAPIAAHAAGAEAE